MSAYDTFRRTMEHLYRQRFGGTVDTLAVSAIGSAALLSTPYFSQVPTPAGVPLAMGGAAWLSWRLMEEIRNKHLYQSKLKIRSAASPLEVPLGESTSKGILLGYTTDDGRPIWLPYSDGRKGDVKQHILMLGQSGVGKTVAGSLMLLQHMMNGGGACMIDAKIDEDNIDNFYRMAAYCGRESDVLIIHAGDPSRSNTYNPILYGDPDEVAARPLALIPSTETNPGADHYKQSANQGLVTLLTAIKSTGLAYNFMDLSILLMSPAALNYLENLVTEPDAKRGLQIFLDQFRNPQGQLDIKKLKDVFGGIAGRLFTFGTGNFGRITSSYSPEINLFEAITSNKLIYLALPTMGKDVAATNFAKMFISDLRTCAAWLQAMPSERRPNPPYFLFCDEAGSYINVNWNRMYEQLRSSGIFMMAAAQTLANFSALSDELAEMVIGNTWTKIFFQIGTQASALEAAELIGKEIQILRTLTQSGSESQSASFLRVEPESGLGKSSGIAYGEREQEGYKVTPDDLKALGRGRCLATFGGHNLFDLQVPKVDFTPEFIEQYPKAITNRTRPKHVAGLDLFRKIDQFLSSAQQKEMTEETESDDDFRPRARRR